jgi:transcriptional regulator with XRE-family HTH domain
MTDRPHRDSWPIDPKEFGAALWRAREKAGLTRRDLAERTAIPEGRIRTIEAGRDGRTTRQRRARLERAIAAAMHERQSAASLPPSRRLVVDLTGLSDAQVEDVGPILRVAVSTYEYAHRSPTATIYRLHGRLIRKDPEAFERYLEKECQRKRLAGILFDRLCSAKVEP